MIHNIYNTVRNDLKTLNSYLKKPELSEEQRIKINRIGLRLLGALGMAFMAWQGVNAFLSGSLFKLITSGAAFIISYDVFMIGKNLDKSAPAQIYAIGHGVMKDIKDLWNGYKSPDTDLPRHYLAHDTILRPVWDQFFFAIMSDKKH